MNLKLNIEEDKELRNFIKDAIRGQVLSIAREEIAGIIKEVTADKLGNYNSGYYDSILKELLQKKLDKEIPESRYGNPGFIKQEAIRIIDKMVREGLNKSIAI